jgi:hypothetical protein
MITLTKLSPDCLVGKSLPFLSCQPSRYSEVARDSLSILLFSLWIAPHFCGCPLS